MTLYQCSFSKKLLDRLERLNRIRGHRADIETICRAIEFAKKHHEGQFRATGEPFYSHAVEIAFMAADYCHKTDVVVASLLHDVVEDTDVTIGNVLDGFGWRVAQIVDMLTRKRPCGKKVSSAAVIDLIAEKGDVEAMLIKMLDRVHNLSTIAPMSPEKQRRIAVETLEAFLPYAMEFDSGLEKTLNILSLNIVEPSLVKDLEYLYSKKLSDEDDDIAVLPSLDYVLP